MIYEGVEFFFEGNGEKMIDLDRRVSRIFYYWYFWYYCRGWIEIKFVYRGIGEKVSVAIYERNY